jgi:hypothetical protein
MWRQSLAALPGIGISLLPKLMCPMCWPGLVSALGLGFLISTAPAEVAFLSIMVGALGFRASQRHGYGPLWLGLIAAWVALIAKFYFEAAHVAKEEWHAPYSHSSLSCISQY